MSRALTRQRDKNEGMEIDNDYTKADLVAYVMHVNGVDQTQ
jgi:hypothetical protein